MKTLDIINKTSQIRARNIKFDEDGVAIQSDFVEICDVILRLAELVDDLHKELKGHDHTNPERIGE